MRAVPISAALLACAVAGCAIRSDVQPVGFGRVDSVCIERNDAVLMEGFLPALVKQIEARGVATEVYAGAPPADCRHRVTYTANWSWDMAMYLTYAQINVYDGVREGAPRIGRRGLRRDRRGRESRQVRRHGVQDRAARGAALPDPRLIA